MMIRFAIALVVASSAATLSCAAPAGNFNPASIIAAEQAALARWGTGDPDGYLEIMAPEITYFDPTTESRLNGREAVKRLIEQIRGRLHIDRADMVNPHVARAGDVAILTFNLVSRGATFNGSPKTDVRWNSTEVYRRLGGAWTIVHSHWSHTTPGPRQP